MATKELIKDVLLWVRDKKTLDLGKIKQLNKKGIGIYFPSSYFYVYIDNSHLDQVDNPFINQGSFFRGSCQVINKPRPILIELKGGKK